MARPVDILHPGASLEWRECSELPVRMTDAQAVWLGNKLYLGGGWTSKEIRDDARLYIYTPTTDTWSIINTPVLWFALVSYQSQLVLVGGREYVDEEQDGPVTNKLWTLTEYDELWTFAELDWWRETLPPMTIKRQQASAVEFTNNILVAGGEDDEERCINTVAVYNGHYWANTQCLPIPCFWMKSTVLNEHWYLMGGGEQGEEVYFSSLKSLVATCPEKPLPNYVWRTLHDVPYEWSSTAVLTKRLIAVGGGGFVSPKSSVYAYRPHSPHSQPWVHVGDMPVGLSSTCTAVLPTGELMVIGGWSSTPISKACVYKGIVLDPAPIRIPEGLVISAMTKTGTQTAPPSISSKTPQDPAPITIPEELEISAMTKTGTRTGPATSISSKTPEDPAPITIPEGLEISAMTKTGTQTGPATSISSKTPEAVWKLQGVEKCDQTSVTVYSSQGQVVEWNGLKLQIHEGSLPEDLHQCKIYIMASLIGQYEMPENSYLVSAIFWLRCEPQCTFTKPITVEIQHCSTMENLSSLKIVRAFCNQENLPYHFKPLGGSFSAETSCGVIEVNHFSGYGVTQEGLDSERKYYSRPFYHLHSHQHSHQIDIIFVWNTEPHINYANKQYSEDGFNAGYHKVIELVTEVIEVALEVAKWTKVMDGQWEIHPAQPKVTKAELDDFKTGRGIPACVLEARPLCENFPQLLHQIILNGIKPPHHELVLSYMPSRINDGWPHDSQSHFTNRGVPASFMIHASHPSVPMPPWQRVAIQPHLAGIVPVLPFHGWGVSGFSQGQDSGIRVPTTSVNYPVQGGLPFSGAIGGQQYNPPIQLSSNVLPVDQVAQHSCPVVPMHPHQSTSIQYPHGGSDYYATATAPPGDRNFRPLHLFACRDQESVSGASHSLSTRLSDNHHSVLLRQLTIHATAWREIGTYLGFLPGELSNIEARPNLIQVAPVSWLSAMLSQWLQWAPGDSRGSTNFATLEDLKIALNQAGLGATAHDLEV